MIPRDLLRAFAGACFLCLCVAPLYGQAIFSVTAMPVTGADSGVAELTGRITLNVTAGTSVAGSFVIRYSAKITNNRADEIEVLGTGGLVGVPRAPGLDAANDSIIISVPPGGTYGNAIQIYGVRVAIAGQNYSVVTANVTPLSATDNSIVAGRSRVTVIDQIMPPFAFDFRGFHPITFTNGVASDPNGSFFITEGYAGAFTDAVSFYGQTVPTRIRITPFPPLPPGVKVTFRVSATSPETLAVLKTTSGQDETVPRSDGSTSVVYEFTSAIESPVRAESFQFYVVLEVQPTAGSGSVAFQAAILPIGTAPPTADLPSTDIPRYWERLVPDDTELLTGSVDLAIPFRAQSSHVYTGIALTNPLDYSKASVTLTAYNADGLVILSPDILNPRTLIIPQKGQLALLATEVFGPSFNSSTLGTIRILGKTPLLEGFYLQGDEQGSRLDGATADLNPLSKWVWPVIFRQAPSAFNTFEFYNSSTAQSANAVLRLYSSAGSLISVNDSLVVLPGATVNKNIEELFPGVNLSSFEGGYVTGQSDTQPLVVRQTFGNALDSNVLPGQTVVQQNKIYLAHFATGGGYTSEITLINMNPSIAAQATLTLIDNNGNALAVSGNPFQAVLEPTKQYIWKVASLFPTLGGALTTGSIRIDVVPGNTGPFSSPPSLIGSLRFSAADGSGSAVLPLLIPPSSDFVYSHVAENLGYYTGVAVINQNTGLAVITVKVFTKDGIQVGSPVLFSLGPGQRMAKLLSELNPATAGQLGGYIRVQSSIPVTSFSLFGSNDGLSLSAIPPQKIGN